MRIMTASPIVLALLLAPTSSAQDVYNEINVGTPQNGIFHGGDIDTDASRNQRRKPHREKTIFLLLQPRRCFLRPKFFCRLLQFALTASTGLFQIHLRQYVPSS